MMSLKRTYLTMICVTMTRKIFYIPKERVSNMQISFIADHEEPQHTR